jgi:hypothetical protein
MAEDTLTCSECGRTASETEAEQERWRFHSDGLGELLPFCGE